MMWNERTKLLLGETKLIKLKESHVLVAGLGGVGGYAVEQLVRAGVENISIIDSDIINITNINRQIIANHSNISKNKTDEFSKRLIKINPNLNLYAYNVFLKDNEIDKSLERHDYNYVIDAIDTLSPKINLIKTSLEKNIPVVSSMGAGGKMDPTKVSISDISKTYNCSLARILRKRLHRHGIRKGFKAVFSSEKTDKNAVILEESANKKSNVGTISYLPAIFGIMCAAAVIQDIVSDN